MALINSPPSTSVDSLEPRGRGVFVLSGVLDGWRNFFNAVYFICNSTTTSGTTAQRPTEGLYIGRVYFDTTLGYPIWLQSIGPVVWCDATGAPA